MFYLLLSIILTPFFKLGRLLGFKRKGGRLIIQTAKIGDFVNTTPLIRACEKCDVIIANVNQSLARHDRFIDKIYIIDEFKKTGLARWKLIWKLYTQGYDEIFVVMPNAFNLYIASLASPKRKAAIKIEYRQKWYTNLLLNSFDTISHNKDKLALESYIHLINPTASYLDYAKHATYPLHQPQQPVVQKTQGLTIGISLSAGNQLKTLPTSHWKTIIDSCKSYPVTFWFFGLNNEQHFLDALLNEIDIEQDKVVNLLGKITLEDLPFHISLLDLYISSDTGNSYIADAVGVPVINFMGPCYSAEQKPLGENALIINTPGLEPFSFIFDAPYKTDLSAQRLYDISDTEWLKIKTLIADLNKAAQAS